MPGENRERHLAVKKKRLPPWLGIAAIVIVVLLLVIFGLRLRGWLQNGQDSHMTVLVNPWNGVENSGFAPRLTDLDGLQVDKNVKKPLQELLAAARQAGFSPALTAGYRSAEEQQALFDEAVRSLLAGGELSENEAMEIASMRVGRPGTSEHELGLAVDFAEDEALFTWLRENAWRYGFILRYPAGSESLTGRDADPCHYRYVGQAAAEQIHAMNATLEEYLSLFYGDSAQVIFE